MILILKIAIFITLLAIAFQDIKERAVFWWLFIIMTGLQGIYYYLQSIPVVCFTNVLINIGFVLFITTILFIYARFKLKISFFKEAFGIGDLCFLIALAMSFPTYTFVIILVSSLLFSLSISLIVLKKTQSIPLAGFMSLFLCLIYSVSWITDTVNLFSI